MKILLIGSGGREHALAWKLAQSPKVRQVFVAPGNVGTAAEDKITNIALTRHEDLIDFCRQQGVEFTVVGPEAPLAAGIVDDFQAAGLAIFGPSKAAARLESSKEYAKDFMQRHGIPTAAYRSFTDAAAAHDYIDQHCVPIVIKADGLAAGKGVVVAMTHQEAHQAVDAMLCDNSLGSAGARVVIEDFLAGEEASFIVMVDGEHILPMATSQDHKRLLDNDQGPNTGGMGAYSPAPVVTAAVYERTMEKIIRPVVAAMAAEGQPYHGFLYAGLMIDEQGEPYTVEFNCRFGDPETQPIMLRLESDLVALIEAALKGTLNQVTAHWRDAVTVGVVLAAAGYPVNPQKGAVITGIEKANQLGKVFVAGADENAAGEWVTAGGRVLCVVGEGTNLQAAREKAYAAVDCIHFSGCQLRHDIGEKGLKHEQVAQGQP